MGRANESGDRDGRAAGPALSLPAFEQAAEKGDREAAMVAAMVYARRAETREALGSWAEALEAWDRALAWAELPLKSVAGGGKLPEKGRRAQVTAQLEELRREAAYGRGVSLYMLGRVEETAALEEDPETERGQLLLGLTLARQAAGSWDGAAWRKVVKALAAAEPRGGYIPGEGRNEQVFFAKGAAELARLYRLGLPGVLARDVGHARHILAAAAEKVRLSDVKTWLERELGHYQKRESGGYIYQ